MSEPKTPLFSDEKKRSRPLKYKILSLDLNIARTKEKYELPGYNLSVFYMDGTADLFLNNPTSEAIPLSQKSATQFAVSRLETHFDCFYITNSQQTGKTLKLAIGEKNFKLIPK